MTPRRAIARMFEADLSAPVVAAGIRTQNPRELSERVAMGRALWRELVVGFASQLGGLRLVDRARADQFLSAVRPMPPAERALIAMGVAALATHAISRRGRLIKPTVR